MNGATKEKSEIQPVRTIMTVASFVLSKYMSDMYVPAEIIVSLIPGVCPIRRKYDATYAAALSGMAVGSRPSSSTTRAERRMCDPPNLGAV